MQDADIKFSGHPIGLVVAETQAQVDYAVSLVDRVMNANLVEYHVPVCADIGQLDAIFVPGEDTILRPLGVKGVAELGLCGVVPAIANAVYHATGKRIRELPITLDKLV